MATASAERTLQMLALRLRTLRQLRLYSAKIAITYQQTELRRSGIVYAESMVLENQIMDFVTKQSERRQRMSDLIRRKDAVSRISDLLILELRAERLPTWNEVYNALAELPSAEPTADVAEKGET